MACLCRPVPVVMHWVLHSLLVGSPTGVRSGPRKGEVCTLSKPVWSVHGDCVQGCAACRPVAGAQATSTWGICCDILIHSSARGCHDRGAACVCLGEKLCEGGTELR